MGRTETRRAKAMGGLLVALAAAGAAVRTRAAGSPASVTCAQWRRFVTLATLAGHEAGRALRVDNLPERRSARWTRTLQAARGGRGAGVERIELLYCDYGFTDDPVDCVSVGISGRGTMLPAGGAAIRRASPPRAAEEIKFWTEVYAEIPPGAASAEAELACATGVAAVRAPAAREGPFLFARPRP